MDPDLELLGSWKNLRLFSTPQSISSLTTWTFWANKHLESTLWYLRSCKTREDQAADYERSGRVEILGTIAKNLELARLSFLKWG